MNKSTVSKILSTSLSLALAVSSAPIPAAAFGPVQASAPAFVSRLTPPEQFGYVASSFSPNGEDRPRMIVISDLHGHIEVQKNIISILDSLVGKLTSGADAQSRVPLYVEGGWAPKLEEPLSFVQNKGVRAFLREYLMRKAEIGAAQTFSELQAGKGTVTLTGVENKDLYEANRRQFSKTYPVRKAVLMALARREEALRMLSEQVEPGAFHKLRQTREDYYKGKVSSDRYAKVLVKLAERNGLKGRAIETLKNIATAPSSEVEIAMSQVHQAVAVKLSESKPLSAWLRTSLEKEDLIRKNVARMDSQMDLLKRLVSNQLTPDEVPMALANMTQLVWIAKQLLQDEKLAVDLEKVVRESLEFYPFAILRDKALVTNAVAALNADSTKAKTGVLIVGGFHSQAIVDYLRSQKIAYLAIHPVVTRDLTTREQLNYIKRLCGEHITPDEIKGDVAHLRNSVDTSAIGPVTSLTQPMATPGDVKKIIETDVPGKDMELGGLNSEAVGKMFDSQEVATAELGANPGDVAYFRGKVNIDAKVPVEATERWDNILKLANRTGLEITIDPTKNVTVTKQGGRFVNQGASGVASPVADIATAIFNSVGQMSPKNLTTVDTMDVQVLSGPMFKKFVERLQDGSVKIDAISKHAMVSGLDTGRPVILLSEDGLQNPYEATHEQVHAFDAEAREQVMETPQAQQKEHQRAEMVAIFKSVVIGAAIDEAIESGSSVAGVGASTKLSVASLQGFFSKAQSQIPQGHFHNALARAITNLLVRPDLSDPNVQTLINALRNELQGEFPELSDYTITQAATQFVTDYHSDGLEDPKNPGHVNPKLKGDVDKTKADLAADAKTQGGFTIKA